MSIPCVGMLDGQVDEEMFSIKDSFRSESFPQISGVESIVEQMLFRFELCHWEVSKSGTLMEF